MKKKKKIEADAVDKGNGNGRGDISELRTQLEGYLKEKMALRWRIKCGKNNGVRSQSNRCKRLQMLENVVIPRLESEISKLNFTKEA